MDAATVFFVIAAFFIGGAIGFLTAKLLAGSKESMARELAEELFRETEALRRDDRDALLERVRESFGDISLEALKKSSEHFAAVAKERLESERTLHSKELDSKKGLIDQQLERMKSELEKVSTLVTEFEKDRDKKFGALSTQLEETGKRTSELIQSTNTLREALAGSKSRGQWGERMAEDVLRVAGFIENVNYLKQKSMAGSREIPDFTFLLPRDRILNMDVKFPFDNYIRYLESDSESDREAFRKQFLNDVKGKIKEISSRGYIDPERNTVDFVLLFIPNEQIYAFIHEQDSSIIDDGMNRHVIVCSPVTLFSVLAVIRAAVDNFALEQTTNRFLSLFGTVFMQWKKYVDSMNKVGTRLDSVKKEYDHLVTTRTNQLDKPLREIDEMRQQHGVEAAESFEDRLLDSGDNE